MLKLNKVCKSFGEKKVLKNISLEVKDGEIVGLLGPNGAGKTTIMRIISGFLSANTGSVENKNVDKLGYLPENNPLYLTMTVGEYLYFICSLKGIQENIGEEIKKIAHECGVEKVIKQKIETLSKGFKQRVGLAATLLGDPKLLILDEPTTGLDPNQIIEIRDLIKKLAKEKTILFSTHILPEAKAICDRVVIINRGEIVLDESIKKVKNLEKKFVELTI